MDNMRISGTEPSSVILSKKVAKNLVIDVPKVPKLAEVNRDGVINPKYHNFNQF